MAKSLNGKMKTDEERQSRIKEKNQQKKKIINFLFSFSKIIIFLHFFALLFVRKNNFYKCISTVILYVQKIYVYVYNILHYKSLYNNVQIN